MQPRSTRRVAVLYWAEDPGRLRLAIDQHLRALEYASDVDVVYVNTYFGAPAWIRLFQPDAVLLHTTFLCLRWSHLFPTWKWGLRWLAALDCPKIAMPQDEYDHSEILDEWLFELGVTTILSNFDASVRDTLYPIMGRRATFGKALTGYVDDATATALHGRLQAIRERPNDIVYRASHLPYWFGSHGQLKHQIGDVVARRAHERGLRTDISTSASATILGDAWLDFLASSKTVVGCESGSSVLDRRGEIRARIRQLLRERPDLSFEQVAEQMPSGWDAYTFFAVSPRHLEALTTKTCQLLVEGTYDGILEPGRHYVPIRPDFANLDEAIETVADDEALQRIADCAYAELVESRRYSYSSLAAELERFLAEPTTAPSSAHALWGVVQRGVTLSEAVQLLRPRSFGRALTVPRAVFARGYVAIRLARKRSAHWQLLHAFRQLETPPVSRWAFLADMLRLGLIANARAGEGNAGEPFDVTTTYDPGASVLRFDSRVGRAPERSTPELDADAVAELRRIVWNHADVDDSVRYALTRRRLISIGIGDRGTYDFEALTLLAPELSAEVTAALDATIMASPAAPHRLVRALSHPRLYGRLVLAVLSERSRLPDGFTQRYLRDAGLRGQVPPRLLAVDLLRLAILERFAKMNAYRIETAFDPATGTFVARSIGASEHEKPAASPNGRSGTLRHIIWDHSHVDTSVPCLVIGRNPPPVKLGADGVYVFEGLSRIAARYPEEAWRLVSGIAGTQRR